MDLLELIQRREQMIRELEHLCHKKQAKKAGRIHSKERKAQGRPQ